MQPRPAHGGPTAHSAVATAPDAVRNPQSAVHDPESDYGRSTNSTGDDQSRAAVTRVPLVLHRRNFSWLTERISGVVEQPAPRWWWVAFAITSSIATFGLFCIGYQISTGVGTWGNQIPVGWAWDITNFVFWIGIGHAGTLISAILFLLRQKWRTSINRSAEAMTLFAVICAAIFPGIHVGRFWMAWYLAPIAEQLGDLAEFPQPADVGRVCGLDLFHCFGLVLVHRFDSGFGDVARPRDHKGQEVSFRNFRAAAGAARTATGAITKWRICFWPAFPRRWCFRCTASYRSTSRRQSCRRGTPRSFPPYFVAGAIFGGFAMVLTLLLPARAIFKLHDVITPQHVDKMAKIILLTGSFVAYAYAMEFFRGVVQRQFLRAFCFLEPHLWPLLVVLVAWHALLQLSFAAAFLVQVVPAECVCRFLRLHVCERWNVV